MVLAVLLTVAQATVPVPRQTANDPTGTSADSENQGHYSNAQATKSVSLVHENQAPPSQGHGNAEAHKDDAQTVVIRKFPAVSVSKDWADWGYWIFGLLLVVVGGFQVLLLWRTLSAIKRQVATMETQSGHMTRQLSEMKRQADVMEGQIQTTKNRERARLILHPEPVTDIVTDEFLSAQEVVLEIENVGYSHAFDVSIEGSCVITTSSSPADPPPVPHSSIIGVIRAGREEVAKSGLWITASDEMWESVIKPGPGDLHLHLWGVMRYKDVFGDTHEKGFRYSQWIESIESDLAQTGATIYPVISHFGWEEKDQPNE